ncbi:MAG: phosphatase PAP2 family protein [Burkholderiaceae bacterium]
MADAITLTDVKIANWFHSHATPSMTHFMLILTNLHGTLAIFSYSILMGLFLIRKKEWYWLLTLLASVPCGMSLNVLMKHAFQRARPIFDHPLLTLSSYSFPSGHTAAATLFYGVLAAYLVCHLKPWRWRIAAFTVILAVMMVTLVGLSRMYLGVHYLSDVLAAAAEGIAWLALCLSVAGWRQHRAGSTLCGNAGACDE